jgi:hypothetical protein
MKNFLVSVSLIFNSFCLLSQSDNSELSNKDDWDFKSPKISSDLFLDTRAINGHTVNVLEKNVLDLRITHRFGNIGTPQSFRTLFGLDNSSDIRIGLEYGISDKIMIGGGRSKGASPFLEVWDALVKYQLFEKKKTPLKITFSSKAFFTSMRSSGISSDITNFDRFEHRLSYHNELLVAFKPVNKLTIQLSPGFTYRNLTHYEDQNLTVNLGSVVRLHLFKKVSIIAEYFAPINTTNYRKENYVNPFGMGIEINTYGHVFLLNFVNSRGIGEGQFIPYTTSEWAKGQFRFGFTIARKFNT